MNDAHYKPTAAGRQQQQRSQQQQGTPGMLETPVLEEASTAVGKAAETLSAEGAPGMKQHR